MSKSRGLGILIVGSVLAASCAVDGTVDQIEQPIINGSNTVAGYRAEVAINGGGCSGTALTNEWVLTAAHCVNDANPGSMTVTLGAGASNVLAAIRHPSLDVALLRLATPLTIGGSTTGFSQNLYLSPASTLVGDTLECVGFGDNTFTGGAGLTLRRAQIDVDSSSADGTTYHMVPNALGQIQWKGDSGGSCFDGDYVTGVQSTCEFIAAEQRVVGCVQVAAPAFASWAYETMGVQITPNNDTRAHASVLALRAFETTVAGSTARASHDGPASTCGCTSGADVWYTFTLAQREAVYLDTAGSGFDTSLVVTDAAGAPIADLCNDDASCTTGGFTTIRESRAARVLDAGTYYVALGGCGAGRFLLHLQHVPTNVGSFFYNSQLTGDSTASTSLVGTSASVPSCTIGNSGEDVRWFVTCGGQAEFFSLCSSDGGGFTRQSGSTTFDPVLYMRSAQSGAETACNDDGGTVGGTACAGTGGDAAQYGSRINNVVAPRGLNTVFVDERTQASGMNYTLRYTVR